MKIRLRKRPTCFVVEDGSGQALASVYFAKGTPGTIMKLPTEADAERIAIVCARAIREWIAAGEVRKANPDGIGG